MVILLQGGALSWRSLKAIPVLLFAMLATFSGCDRVAQHGTDGGGVLPDQEISNFKLTQTSDGRVMWTLSATLGLVFEEADRVETTSPQVDFFDEDGELRSTLTARTGLLRQRTSDMEVLGNVVVTSTDGTVLETERLLWSEQKGRIETDRAVRVTKDGDVMTGIGAEADPDLKNLRILSDFKAYVRSASGELEEEQ